MLRELKQHGANERAVESLIGKVSMGAQSRLFTKPKQSLAMQMLPGMQKFISGLKKDALIPQSVVLEEFATMVAQRLQEKAEAALGGVGSAVESGNVGERGKASAEGCSYAARTGETPIRDLNPPLQS